MEKGADAFRSIGEVAKLVGVAPHVLRYWETQFSQLNPMKRRDGRRYYRPDDVRLVAGLCEILREEGLTIRGARKLLARDRGESVRNRGAARLGEVMGSALNSDSAPTRSPTSLRPAPDQDADHLDGAAPPVAARATPRSVLSRKRARSLPPQAPTLPLFADIDDATVIRIDGHWLIHLVETAAALRAHQDGNTLPQNAVRPARDLRDALATLD